MLYFYDKDNHYIGSRELKPNEIPPVNTTLNSILLTPNGIDDTESMRSCNGKVVYLTEGTFICSKLTFGKGTHIMGAGIGKTIIKLKDGSNSFLLEMVNADHSSVQNLTLDGNLANNPLRTSDYDSALLIYATQEPLGNSSRSVYRNLEIVNCRTNGLTILGKSETKNRRGSWHLSINHIHINNCYQYCFYDNSTDNHYSDFYISYGSKAGLMVDGAGSNMYSNFKVDGQSGNWGYTDRTSRITGGNIIVNNSTNIIFNNLDCQSGAHCGMKLHGVTLCQIQGNFDNNGLNGADGTGLYLGDYTRYVTGMVHFGTPGVVQLTDIYIDPTCYENTFVTAHTNDGRIDDNGTNNIVTTLRN